MTSRRFGAASQKSDMAGGGKRATSAEQQKHDTVKDNVKKRRSDQSDVPISLREEVGGLYKLSMPEDFYTFWTFCAEIDPHAPSDVLRDGLGLQLVGPYDILSGKHSSSKKTDVNYNLHWRFFYDPPEFQTVIVGDSRTQFHIGYYRDSPDDVPGFVGTNDAVKGCLITPAGDNLFSAVRLFATKKLKEITDKKTVATIKDLVEKITTAANKYSYSLEQKSTSMKRRDKKVVTKSFHGAGLMVPVDKNDVGYRELPETDGNLKKICKAIVEAPSDDLRMKAFAPIQEMMTFVQFANDECDYGMGYELGIDLFCYGSHYFHKVAGQLLPLAYKLLKRDLFAEIIESHLANRKKENVNQLEV